MHKIVNLFKLILLWISSHWWKISSKWDSYKVNLEKHNYRDPYPSEQNNQRKKTKMHGKRVTLAELQKPPSERKRF
jgi:hypothetical protein